MESLSILICDEEHQKSVNIKETMDALIDMVLSDVGLETMGLYVKLALSAKKIPFTELADLSPLVEQLIEEGYLSMDLKQLPIRGLETMT